MDSILKELEVWKSGKKSRSVCISRDDGYGAACWNVDLYSVGIAVHAAEVSFFDIKESECPKNIVFARPPWTEESDNDPDWPGLEATIIVALKRAKELEL